MICQPYHLAHKMIHISFSHCGTLCLAAGVYNETVFQGIDYILATLAKHNIKAIINLLTCV